MSPVKPLSLRSQCARWLWQSASPVLIGPLPKGDSTQAVPCQTSVRADDPVAVPKISALPNGGRLKF